MRTACFAALVALCAAAPCRADELTRWLDQRAQEYALARLGLEPGELHDPELLWLADEGDIPWDRFTHRLGPPRWLPPTVRLSLELTRGEPGIGLTLEFPFPRRFPVARPSPRPGSAAPEVALDALLEGEPAIADVQRAAVRYVACDAETLAGLGRDSRAYGALPEVTLGGGLDGDRDVDVDPFDNVEGAQAVPLRSPAVLLHHRLGTHGPGDVHDTADVARVALAAVGVLQADEDPAILARDDLDAGGWLAHRLCVVQPNASGTQWMGRAMQMYQCWLRHQ